MFQVPHGSLVHGSVCLHHLSMHVNIILHQSPDHPKHVSNQDLVLSLGQKEGMLPPMPSEVSVSLSFSLLTPCLPFLPSGIIQLWLPLNSSFRNVYPPNYLFIYYSSCWLEEFNNKYGNQARNSFLQINSRSWWESCVTLFFFACFVLLNRVLCSAGLAQTHYIANIELSFLLVLSPKCWAYMSLSPHPASSAY